MVLSERVYFLVVCAGAALIFKYVNNPRWGGKAMTGQILEHWSPEPQSMARLVGGASPGHCTVDFNPSWIPELATFNLTSLSNLDFCQ